MNPIWPPATRVRALGHAATGYGRRPLHSDSGMARVIGSAAYSHCRAAYSNLNRAVVRVVKVQATPESLRAATSGTTGGTPRQRAAPGGGERL